MKFTMGDIVGKITQTTITGAGYLTQGVGIVSEKIIKDEKLKNNIYEKTEKISQNLKDSANPIANKVSGSISKAILTSKKGGENIAKFIAEKVDASPENIKKAEKIGGIAGKAVASGVAAGACVMVAGASAVTTGASVFTHGMATLGLGSMYGGLVTVSAIAGSVFATEKDNKDEDKTKQNKLEENNEIKEIEKNTESIQYKEK